MTIGKWLSLGCCLLITLTGCKREDNEPPSVALSQPNEGFTVVADSTFFLSGRASDNEGLSSITAILFHSVTEQIVKTKTVTLDGLEKDFQFSMPAGDRYTETGDYTLKVTATDRAENFGSAFIQIRVQALPLEYRGMVWAGKGSGNAYSIFRRDTAGTTVTGPGGLQDMTGLLVDSRNHHVAAVQSTGGVLTAWNLEDFAQVLRVDLAQGSGTATFSGISMNQDAYYTAVRVPAYLRSYRFDGSLNNNFDAVLYPGTAVTATSDRVYLGVAGILGTPKKVDAYDLANESIAATQVLGWDVERILVVSADEIVVCGNLNGVGQVVVLDRQSLVRHQELDLQEEFVDATTANGRVWVLGATGLREFYPASGTVSSLLTPGTYTALGVDATSNRLLLGGTNGVEVRTGAGVLVETVTGGFGEVRFIGTHYNK